MLQLSLQANGCCRSKHVDCSVSMCGKCGDKYVANIHTCIAYLFSMTYLNILKYFNFKKKYTECNNRLH